MAPSSLSLGEAVPLACALLDHAAVRAGVRALIIKGPALTVQGLRSERLSVDVDALVEPYGIEALVGELRSWGWSDRWVSQAPMVLGSFARTLNHAKWPNEIDLHSRFPGLLNAPPAVFDHLWNRRTVVRIANRQIRCPHPADHALVAALNCLREISLPDKAAQFDELVAYSIRHPDISKQDLASSAVAMGAEETLRPFFARLDLPISSNHDTPSESLMAWRIATHSESPTAVGWVASIAAAPWPKRPRLLWRALWPRAEELRQTHGAPDAGARQLWQLRRARMRRGLSALPGAFRAVRLGRRVG